MKNKFIAGLLTLATLCALNTGTVKAETLVTEAGDQHVPVTCNIGSTFTVKLPAAIALTDINGDKAYDYSGSVGVKGDLMTGETVGVTVGSSVTLYDMTSRPDDPLPTGEEEDDTTHKASKNTRVELTKMLWTYTEIDAVDYINEGTLTIAPVALEAANWKGQLTFTITGPTP